MTLARRWVNDRRARSSNLACSITPRCAVLYGRRKIDLLRPVAKGKTIQPVLIVRGHPSRELIDQGYFYRIIQARELLKEPD